MKDLILLFSFVLVPTLAYKESLQTKLNFSNSTIHKRHKRDWIWNYMHITEEISLPLPHYVGKIISSVRNKNAKYVLEGEYANTIFKVDEETGDIYAFERLDREKKSEYELTALIIDKITNQRMEPPSTFVIKVHDINDNVPIFVQKVFNGSVPEMSSVGTSVTKVTAVDADDPTIADHAKVIYQVIEGENYFTVDESGVISTATANLDREAQPTYKIVVKAKDSLGNTGREASIATVLITLLDINDNFPTFKKESFHFKVPENIQIKDEVGRLEVVDVDEPQNRNTTYNFVRGYFQDTFKIITIPSTNEGIIKPQKPLNYEEIKEYKFNVEATDPTVIPRYYKPGGSKSIASITIEVLDVDEPPVFSPSLYIFKVEENNPQKNKQIGTVSAKDPDAANRAIRYIPRISSPPGNYIKISDTGMVFLNQALDRETSAWYNITIRAVELADKNTLSDKESQAHIHIQVIDVNDNAPELTYPEEPRVCENAEPGQVVTRISATDKDEMLPGVYFKYSLATEDSNFTLSDNHDNTANVTVKYGQFNRELAKTHFLAVMISDNGKPALTSTNTLPISICKCNERGEVTFCEASAKIVGVSIQALVAIFVCILTIIVITLLLFLRKRHKKDLNVLRNNVAEIHEQLVTYDEEGGGEMDTTSYDVSVLNSARKNTMKPPRLNLEPVLSPYAQIQKPTENGHSGTGEMEIMIEVKKDEADNDGDLLPYDTLHIYGYEGAESIAESLSSLESGSSDSDIDYDFLNDWGPRFKMLAELYGSEPTIDFVY